MSVMLRILMACGLLLGCDPTANGDACGETQAAAVAEGSESCLSSGTTTVEWCLPDEDGAYWGVSVECLVSPSGAILVGRFPHGVELVGEHAAWRRGASLSEADIAMCSAAYDRGVCADGGLP